MNHRCSTWLAWHRQELEQKLRDYLGGFGFQSDKVNEATQRFSGGEKARLVLALIVWQRPKSSAAR
nr:glutathione-regulated potassium-efflux system ATP-binding protein [Raoultella sp. NCTC 9187]